MSSLARDALARNLCGRLCDQRRTHDELRVVDDVLAGLEHGAETMGPLDLERDDRSFDEEAAQECRDLLAYLAMQKVAAQHRQRERLRCEVADEIAAQALAQVTPIETGLRELRDAATYPPYHPQSFEDWPSAHELGGEGG